MKFVSYEEYLYFCNKNFEIPINKNEFEINKEIKFKDKKEKDLKKVFEFLSEEGFITKNSLKEKEVSLAIFEILEKEKINFEDFTKFASIL
jgi:hypothetical protein